MRNLQIERKGSGADVSDLPAHGGHGDVRREDAARWTAHARRDEHRQRHRRTSFNVTFDGGARPALHRAARRDDGQAAATRTTCATRSSRGSSTSLERSGGDANLSARRARAEDRHSGTCLIIALFGAPLATSTQRGGSAYGIAVSLATTMIFLLMIQLTRAIGGKGVIPPDFAAWIPGVHLRLHRAHPARPSAHLSGPNAMLARDRRQFPVVQRTSIQFFRRITRFCVGDLSRHRAAHVFLRATSAARFGDPATYVPETIRQMKNIGVDSIPLTVIVAAFIGGVIALQTRYQLFPGVQLSIIGLATRLMIMLELGPLLTGLVLTGPRRRPHDGGDRDDARDRADRRARDARLRSGRVSHRAAAARGDRHAADARHPRRRDGLGQRLSRVAIKVTDVTPQDFITGVRLGLRYVPGGL